MDTPIAAPTDTLKDTPKDTAKDNLNPMTPIDASTGPTTPEDPFTFPILPEGQIFTCPNIGIEQINEFAREHGYAVIKARSTTAKTGIVKTIYLRCNRGGQLKTTASIYRTTTRVTGCKMAIVLRRKYPSSNWVLTYSHTSHNHPPHRRIHILPIVGLTAGPCKP
ncbi:uncharacterized protein N7483_008643 [Penicillium malachiteum]|uniref:uncharacterized protein n=1 Tax=Penicillium malachiteum TaxID=1324776 RepID=UPI0025467901|nr:uncharacterized protein N7483_008643 [Penicillium malachiteum]KAJ5720709.1 hypothetical protein N7483_008643 [Penicillium malachiteum]